MDIDDVGYMYHLVVLGKELFIFGAPTSWSTEDMMNAQEMRTGVIIFDAETYDKVLDVQTYLLDPENYAGELNKKMRDLVSEYYCGALDMQDMKE